MNDIDPPELHSAFGTRLNRDQLPVLANGIPWVTILLASLVPMLPIIAPAPVLPPLSYMLLLGWRLLRPGLLPLWAGFPLGLFDDLYSGQPFGCGILLFSLTLILLDLVEFRFPWRNFWQNWLAAAALITGYLFLCSLVSGAHLGGLRLEVILPQLLLSLLAFPIVSGLVAALDRIRLLRVRRIG